MEIKYFDHAATTPVRDEVIKEMIPYLGVQFGNASAMYSIGRKAKRAMNNAREKVANVLNCEMRSLYPEEDKPFCEWTQAVKYVPDLNRYNLSVYSLFERQNKKVIHRAAGYLQISMGNHKVTMFPQFTEDTGIRVYHYNIRGKQQFMEKMINGGKQLEQHKGRHGGRHWRYFYRLYKEGKLEEEYDRVIGTQVIDQLRADGYIYEDSAIADFFRNFKMQ